MSALETILAALAVIMASALAAALITLLRRNRSAPGPGPFQSGLPEMAAIKVQVEGIFQAQQSLRDGLNRLETGLKSVETRVVDSSGGVRESLQRDLQGARSIIDSLKAGQESRRQVEDDLRQSTRRIEAVIAGSRSRGAAGENILAEAFRSFPGHMIETDFRIGGKTVEFALKLVDGTRVPIDSKWPRADLLELLDGEASPERQAEITAQLEKAVEAKVREVSKYIDAASTVPWAVAAVPDSVFSLCRCAHFNAYRAKVVLMPYGLAVPYLLSLYNLHLQFCRSIQIEKLESYLVQLEGSIDKLVKEVEGRMSNAITQLGNSRDECRTALGKMRVASDSFRSLPVLSPEETPAGNTR